MNPLSFIKQHKLTLIFSIIAGAAVFGIFFNRAKNSVPSQTAVEIPSVSLVPVSNYVKEKTVDLDNGIVQSLGQADLRSQFTAPITALNVKLGDMVSAGQTLVQLQNNDIAAQLEQARSGLDAARSRLEETKRGSRAEDIAITQTSTNEAKAALVNSIKDAYSKSDDSIHNHIDKFFINPRSQNIDFSVVFNVGGNQVTLQPLDEEVARQTATRKYKFESILSDWQKSLANLDQSSSDTEVEDAFNTAENNLRQEIDFMDKMAPIVNSLSIDNNSYKQLLDGYKGEFSAARATVSGALASLQGSQTAWKTARETLSLKLAGSSPEQIKQSQTSVDQAQAAVNGLKATLAKTSIVSPISGKISYISGHIGELASAGQLIASVINPNALQVKTYASESDLPRIAQGDEVTIQENAKGIVQNVSPSIDPATKKAEINITVTQNGDPAIVIGQNVNVKIASAKPEQTEMIYLLPIQAVQFSGNQNYVLSVDQNNTIFKIPVTTSELVGETIQVTQGLAPETKVLPAIRGFKEGDKVNIQ